MENYMSFSFVQKTVAASLFAAVAATSLMAPVANAAKFKAVGNAASATINCTVPNHVKCKIHSAKGIKSVKIQSNTGQGTIYVVNKTYRNCPKNVTVTWDSAYPSSNKQIAECSSGLKLKSK